ncbi:hypothetical protein [Alteromonas sp. KUL49]|uniref:hypothetical protein n=1 Tax=Alteromonas sp. KUL49 TaxID=2480798 RepID=UPI00102F0572|nr:hypothetical protein [Alteromonas sp. KUL49]TAP34959.1 hypothetical protein EYS00_19095 [Alteromonas sp. KUL49]GEA13502.1 hypothetical protein KUL49_38770 [Alteromonas sp. KUL49]
MNKSLIAIAALALVISGCGDAKTSPVLSESQSVILVGGQWITGEDGNIMEDPQTSGLIAVNSELITIADASALEHQQLKLHTISPDTALITAQSETFTQSRRVRRSCFSTYLSSSPDLEALVVNPANPDVFYTVTEDATRTGALSVSCQNKVANTGSTDYPTLLVRLERKGEGLIEITHVRPLQFPAEYEVGNFPNDGIEGMALHTDGTLYLGLEKDKAGQPRVFTLTLNEGFWQSSDFAVVSDPQLDVPRFTQGNHPINGMTLYTHQNGLFLLAAARNDDELWIIDTQGNRPTKKLQLSFQAPALEGCAASIMDNASIEGLAVIGQTLYLINDPWKKHYLENITCEAEKPRYEAMAPLLFELTLDSGWFE